MKKLTLITLLTIFALLGSACGASEDGYDYTGGSNQFRDNGAGYDNMPAPDTAPGDRSDSVLMDDGRYEYDTDGNSYLVIEENPAVSTDDEATLTFSLKVDTAAYTNIARYIESGNLPPRDAVRVEEMINYFTYDNRMDLIDGSPFAISAEVGPSPFNENKHIAYIRVKTADIDKSELPPSNLTFLIDTSGSMSSHDRLPLLKESFALLVDTLSEDDKVSIVTYAGSSAVVLDGVSGADKDRIMTAIGSLEAGGSTAGAEGITTAYKLAEKNFIESANNRVILATDGDFNVGVSSNEELAKLIGDKRGNGIYLSILGYGMGNLRDDLMETLSKEGNGNYFYINNLASANKALVEELASNLYTIADDVKAQIEFNPRNVRNYRLIGYENRRLRNEDFNNDAVDAGEIGIGTDVIMMFELELYSTSYSDGTRYGTSKDPAPDFADELFDVRLRYKNPGEENSNLITKQVYFSDIVEKGSSDFRFATAVAIFGHLLRGGSIDSDYATVSYAKYLAEDALGTDSAGYRMDFLRLLEKYERLL